MHRALRLLLAGLGTAAMVAATTGTASASGGESEDLTCAGGPIAAGHYESITVTGLCFVPGDLSTVVSVSEDVSVRAGAALVANFPAPGPGGLPEGDAALKVRGDIRVGVGGTLILGCAPSFGCNNVSQDSVGGSVVANQPLGLLMHGDSVRGSVSVHGGGGGVTCAPAGVFAVFGSPVYSTIEDSSVGGSVSIVGLQSCWLGIARVNVGENVRVINNNLADPDAIEILSNQIDDNLVCFGNSMVWNSFEAGFPGLFPRIPQPNTVLGNRRGQCVLSSPLTQGGPLGPGPF